MIYLLLGSFLEITTVSTCLIFRENEFSQIINTILKKGYRVAEEYTEQVRDIINNHVEETAKDYNHIKMIIPFYNLFYAYRKSKKNVNKCYKKIKNDQLLLKLTEEEKREIKNIKNPFDRIDWALNTSYDGYTVKDIESENEEEYHRERPKHKNILIFERMKDRYDIAEVEALSDTYQYGYRIGLVNDNPVAIIGVYDVDTQFELVKFPEFDHYQEFKSIDRKDGYKYMYDVYQYTSPHDEYAFEQCLDNIYKTRDIINKDYNNRMLSNSSIALESGTNIFQKNLK